MQFTLPNNHLVVNTKGNRFIVDTGSPWSFNYMSIPTLEINGKQYSFNRSIACPKETVDRLTGENISGIIGIDILEQTGLTVDLKRMSLEFADSVGDERTKEYVFLSFDFFMGKYIVTNDLFLGRQLNNVIVDTGAPVSYITSSLYSDFEPVGMLYEDISPEFGVLRGEYHKADLVLRNAGREYVRTIKIGKMPQILDMFGIFDGIMGILSLTEKQIVFDFSKKMIAIKP